MDLGGFGWIRLDLGADSCGFLSWILSAIEGFSWSIEGFGRLGWVRLDLGIFGELGLVNLSGFV